MIVTLRLLTPTFITVTAVFVEIDDYVDVKICLSCLAKVTLLIFHIWTWRREQSESRINSIADDFNTMVQSGKQQERCLFRWFLVLVIN